MSDYNADLPYSDGPPLPPWARSTAYKKANEWVLYGFNLCEGDFGRVCQILPIFTRNRLIRGPMAKSCTSATPAVADLKWAMETIQQVNLCTTSLGQT